MFIALFHKEKTEVNMNKIAELLHILLLVVGITLVAATHSPKKHFKSKSRSIQRMGYKVHFENY